jgi:Patched family
VPLTNLTGSLAFVSFGVGLDDTFIIMHRYNRTDPRMDTVERIRETMESIGLSIFITTLTTVIAFGLGTLSAIPAIYWLCWYAWPTILIDFLYQITYFIALLALDERRIQENRRDCCFCQTASTRKPIDKRESPPEEEKEEEWDDIAIEETAHAPCDSDDHDITESRFVKAYTDFLLRPRVKIAVIAIFLVFLGICMYFATLLKQEFKAEEIVPTDSYVRGFLHGVNEFSEQVIMVGAYFRNVDQSDKNIQLQMLDYITKLSSLPQINETTPFCWVRDFQEIGQQNELIAASLSNLSFSQQLDFALSVPAIKEVYGSDIVRNSDGNITASRCWFFMKNLDMQDVQDQTAMLLDQRAISLGHPANEGKSEFSFFSFDLWYIIWVRSPPR